MRSFISFVVNPYDPKELYVAGCMDSYTITKSLCGLDPDWGYRGFWEKYMSSPLIEGEGLRPTSHPRHKYGVPKDKIILSPSELETSIADRFGSFEEFEKWAIEQGGMKSGVYVNDSMNNVSEMRTVTATGRFSSQRVASRVSIADSESVQITYLYPNYELDRTSYVLGNWNMVQIVGFNTVAISGSASFQFVKGVTDSETCVLPSYLIGGSGSMQEGHRLKGQIGGRKVFVENKQIVSLPLIKEELIAILEKARRELPIIMVNSPVSLRNMAINMIEEKIMLARFSMK